jgi:Serine/Threonine/Tyrosine Kinase found in polyvalent proteins
LCYICIIVKKLKDELQNIIRGKSGTSQKTLIQTVANYFRRSQAASPMGKENKQYKQKETEKLIEYCTQNNLWANDKLNFDLFVSEGAEQKVYIKDDKTVYKLNDSIYYLTWLDYLTNLSLNNYFFSDTTYTLVGFCLVEKKLYAIVEQPFIKANQPTNLDQVNELATSL